MLLHLPSAALARCEAPTAAVTARSHVRALCLRYRSACRPVRYYLRYGGLAHFVQVPAQAQRETAGS
jgi:hypothetical protein